MTNHFSLDIDPEQLRGVAGKLDTLSNHVKSKAAKVSASPGEIGDKWQGDAATSVMDNMTSLGSQMDRYDEKFGLAADALRTLAGHYEHALEVELSDLNRKYEAAQTAYDGAVERADSAYQTAQEKIEPGPGRRWINEELQQSRSSATSGAYEDRRLAWQNLEDDFEELKETLKEQTRTAGTALAEAVVAEVTDAQVEEFRRRSTDAGQPSPMSIGALERFDDSIFTLAGDKQYAAEGKEAAEHLEEILGDSDLTDEEVTAYIESLEAHNPAFREALVENLDPEQLVQIQYSAHHLEAEDGQRYGRIVTEIAGILAQGSRAEVQGGEYPIDPYTYDKLISTYKEYAPETGEGYALLAEIIHAGQGGDNTWDSDLLTEVGNDLLTYEREHVAEYDSWSWSEVTRDWRPITEQGINDYGTELPIDPLAMVMDSMHHDPVSAQDFVTAVDTADTDKLHYLYDRTAGTYFETFGYTLGGVLDAATTFVGGDGPGSRDYVSAEIVNDMVNWYGENEDRYRIMLGQDFVDILTRFMPAVNHPGSTVSPVMAGDPDGTYSWQRLTLPNLDEENLAKVMQMAMGTDYYTDDGSRPYFQQFSAVQVAAMKSDFMEYAEKNGLEGGHLETLAEEQGELKQRTIDWLTESMMAQGASEDEANESAREAADFIGGLLTESIPVDKLGGPGGAVAGAGVEGIKNWAVDQWFPLTDNKGTAEAEGHAEAIRNRIHGPDTYLNWLDEAGLLDGEADVDRYVAQNPDNASFTEPGEDGSRHIMDIQQMRAEANAAAKDEDWDSPAIERWEDFMRYYHDQGEPYLAENDINTNFKLGTLVEASK